MELFTKNQHESYWTGLSMLSMLEIDKTKWSPFHIFDIDFALASKQVNKKPDNKQVLYKKEHEQNKFNLTGFTVIANWLA